MKKLKRNIFVVCLIGLFIFTLCKIYTIYQDNQLKLESLYFQHQILLDSWLRTNQILINNSIVMASTINEIKLKFDIESNNTKKKITESQTEIAKLKVKLHNLKSNLNALQKKPSYKYLKSVTVRIFQRICDDYGKIGTGTIIKITDDYTYILTNKHVAPINNKDNIYIVLGNKRIKAEVVKNSQFVDLSLIRVFGKLDNKNAINGISKSYPSDKVYSVGMYLGNYYIYTDGTFAGYQNTKVLINAPSSFGCSGSGVFNKDGNLIAVIFATNILKFLDTDSAKAVCVSIESINLFLYGII